MTAKREGNRILVLGAGLVARPGVRYLLEHFPVTMASRTVSKAEAIVGDHPNGRAQQLDVNDRQALSALVAEHDLVISLLPAPLHPQVAELCLEHGKLMATTSYISPAMREMDAAAREKGLIFLNECGVDPGIDHMTAMRIFDDARSRGGKIVSFRSYCGGLPAPDANDNPLGYKFSWAPRGVLVAATNPAHYLQDGRERWVAGHKVLADVHALRIPGVGLLEAYPNRDSLAYLDIYSLKRDEMQTMYRGTLRYPGHCARWKAWIDLGLFSQEEREFKQRSLAGVLRTLLDADEGADLQQLVADKPGLPEASEPVRLLGWLGFYSEEPLDEGVKAPIDALAQAMLARMRYKPGERDMLVMHHEVVAVFDDHRERTVMDMVDFGIPNGDTSMARTVSLPLAIGVRLILEGKVQARGVVAPVLPELYEPILEELEELGVHFEEHSERLPL